MAIPDVTQMMVSMTAIAFGTVTGRDGTIIHTNPDADDERYHSPTVAEGDVKLLEERGLAKVNSDSKPKSVVLVAVDPNDVTNVATERTAENAEIDAKTNDITTPLTGRDSIAWQDPERVLGGQVGDASDQVVDDAPPLEGAAPPATDAPPANTRTPQQKRSDTIAANKAAQG